MGHHVWLFSVLSGTLLVTGACVLPILWRGSSEEDGQRAALMTPPSYQTARCRPPEACAHCRTGWAHDGSCWRWGPCRSRQCSSSLCHTLGGGGGLSVRKTQDCKPLQTLSPSSLLSARVTHRWCEHAGQARRHTCIRDQEVHHFNSVKVDHHTTTIGGRRDKDVTRALESGEFS